MSKNLLLLTILIVLGNNHLYAQNDVSVERALYSIEAGLLGIWASSEIRISNEFVFRPEIGFDGGFGIGSSTQGKFLWILSPTISAESRWYYNLQRRSDKGKKIAKNTANFLSLQLGYDPDWFTISNADSRIIESGNVNLKWGIRRVWGKHFTYEMGAGVGFVQKLDNPYIGPDPNSSNFYPVLFFRLGYTL